MIKKILITGSNGFISKNLTQFLIKKNYIVNCTNKTKSNKFFFDLNNNNNLKNLIPKFDFLIHLSYFRHQSYIIENKVNLEGSKYIFSLAKSYNAKIIYISSQSADQKSLSHYGKTKFNIELIASKYNAYIIRPGLVYSEVSDLSLFSNIEKLVKKMPILFVPTGLSKKINLCNINYLFDKINLIINGKIEISKINVNENEQYYLIDLIKKIASKNNKKLIIIKVNYRIILFIIKIFEFLNFKLKIKSDSLRSLI